MMARPGGHGCCVIMAGGRGTRFWPLSRAHRPKQLLALVGERSLLQATYDRVAGVVGPERILVITNRELVAATVDQLPELPAAHVIGEPVGRNTAPCAVLGMGIAQRLAPGAPVALLPADHAITQDDVFAEQLQLAFDHVATTSGVVTFGIPPTHPETGYGYLEVGAPVDGMPSGVIPGVAFVEKPDLARAEAYLAGGRHLWNSGIFVWSAEAFSRAAREHMPAIAATLSPAVDAYGQEHFTTALAAAFEACPAESIDYAVMEKLPAFDVIRSRYGWSDLGSWTAWGDLAPELGEAGCGYAEVVSLAASGNVVHAPGKLVALIGVEGLVVVDTGDALLICRKRDDQLVKDITVQLGTQGRDDLL